jgi:hypothetical protein
MGKESSTNGESRKAYRILWGSDKERNHYEDQEEGAWIALIWILE